MRVLCTAIFCALLITQTVGQGAAPLGELLYRSEVEFLRVANGHLYLWNASNSPVNDDFTISLAAENLSGFRCALEAVAGQVLTSEVLPDSVIDLLSSEQEPDISIYLDRSHLDLRPLSLGLPQSLATLASPGNESLVPTLSESPQLSFYKNLDAAEVDLAVGQLDMVLLPQNELTSDLECRYRVYQTRWHIEWYLACDLSDFDLLPAALSYSLKGLLAEVSAVSSSLVDSASAERYFPANSADAFALFAQMSQSQAQGTINWNGNECYPATLGEIRRRLNADGASVSIQFDVRAAKVQLLPVILDDRDSLRSVSAVRQLSDYLTEAGFGWYELLTSSSAEPAELSRRLSSELKLIPLGSRPLILLARPEVHQVAGHFYLVNSQ